MPLPPIARSRKFIAGFSACMLLFVGINVYDFRRIALCPYDYLCAFGFPLENYASGSGLYADDVRVFWGGMIINVAIAVAASAFVGLICAKISAPRKLFP